MLVMALASAASAEEPVFAVLFGSPVPSAPFLSSSFLSSPPSTSLHPYFFSSLHIRLFFFCIFYLFIFSLLASSILRLHFPLSSSALRLPPLLPRTVHPHLFLIPPPPPSHPSNSSSSFSHPPRLSLLPVGPFSCSSSPTLSPFQLLFPSSFFSSSL